MADTCGLCGEPAGNLVTAGGDCGQHTFCLSCLQKYVRDECVAKGHRARCPTCARRITAVPAGGAAAPAPSDDALNRSVATPSKLNSSLAGRIPRTPASPVVADKASAIHTWAGVHGVKQAVKTPQTKAQEAATFYEKGWPLIQKGYRRAAVKTWGAAAEHGHASAKVWLACVLSEVPLLPSPAKGSAAASGPAADASTASVAAANPSSFSVPALLSSISSLPVVKASEDGDVLSRMLRLAYLVPDPTDIAAGQAQDIARAKQILKQVTATQPPPGAMRSKVTKQLLSAARLCLRTLDALPCGPSAEATTTATETAVKAMTKALAQTVTVVQKLRDELDDRGRSKAPAGASASATAGGASASAGAGVGDESLSSSALLGESIGEIIDDAETSLLEGTAEAEAATLAEVDVNSTAGSAAAGHDTSLESAPGAGAAADGLQADRPTTTVMELSAISAIDVNIDGTAGPGSLSTGDDVSPTSGGQAEGLAVGGAGAVTQEPEVTAQAEAPVQVSPIKERSPQSSPAKVASPVPSAEAASPSVGLADQHDPSVVPLTAAVVDETFSARVDLGSALEAAAEPVAKVVDLPQTVVLEQEAVVEVVESSSWSTAALIGAVVLPVAVLGLLVLSRSSGSKPDLASAGRRFFI